MKILKLMIQKNKKIKNNIIGVKKTYSIFFIYSIYKKYF